MIDVFINKYHDKLIHLLYFGYMADQAIKVGEKIDYVKEEFVHLKKDIENQIENNVSESMSNIVTHLIILITF